MANLLISFPNRGDSGTFSGGSWEATLPLTNLQDRRTQRVARSTNATLASTQFDCDLGTELYLWVGALFSTNLTMAAQWRIRGSNDAAFATSAYDSGWVDVYPEIYPAGVLNFGDPGWFDGKLAQVDYDAGYRVEPIHVLSTLTSARYWRVEIDDTANGDGYVEVGRAWFGYAYQPTANMANGVRLGWETSSSRTETDGGAWYHLDRPRRRHMDFVLSQESEDEGLVRGFEVLRQLGTAGQLLVVFDPDDTHHLHRRAFVGTLRDLSPLTFPYSAWTDQPFRVVEEL